MLVYFLVAYLQTIDRLLILAILVGLLWFTWFNGLLFRIVPKKVYLQSKDISMYTNTMYIQDKSQVT